MFFLIFNFLFFSFMLFLFILFLYIVLDLSFCVFLSIHLPILYLAYFFLASVSVVIRILCILVCYSIPHPSILHLLSHSVIFFLFIALKLFLSFSFLRRFSIYTLLFLYSILFPSLFLFYLCWNFLLLFLTNQLWFFIRFFFSIFVLSIFIFNLLLFILFYYPNFFYLKISFSSFIY
mgnify:CR=1 FL=1